MTAARKAPIVERRALAARRFAAKPDDLAELRVIIATMRDVPREALESFPDMLHLLRRLSGRLDALAGRLQVQEAKAPRKPRTRLPGAAAVKQADIIAGVFGRKRTRPARETTRTVTSRKGKAVCVVEWPSSQIELPL